MQVKIDWWWWVEVRTWRARPGEGERREILALRTGRKLHRPAAIANQMEDSDTTWRVARGKGKEILFFGKRPSRPLGAQEENERHLWPLVNLAPPVKTARQASSGFSTHPWYLIGWTAFRRECSIKEMPLGVHSCQKMWHPVRCARQVPGWSPF